MGTIGGEGSSITPEMRAFYKEKFEESATLFQRSLEEYQKADPGSAKREKFKQVMEEARQIMNEAARAGLGREAKFQKELFEKDYQNTFTDPTHETPENFEKLNQDIDRLKGSL